MPAVLAAFADKVILEAAKRFMPIAIIAIVFGVVYWLVRRSMTAREKAKREAWIKERREKREIEKHDAEGR
jgi:hypothetical protein